VTHSEEIRRLKEIGLETESFNVVNTVISNLAAYGPKSIPAITEIVESQANRDIRLFGFKTIEKIMAYSKPYPRIQDQFL
jgi:hypothetical protein